VRQRQVVVLRHVGDLPEAEIAHVLGISRSTVSSTLADAHRALARRLRDDPIENGVLDGSRR
jgi:RNA polymerase sigma factor (sigma-70 family)